MTLPIRVLIVEDLPTDAELAERELRAALGACEFRRVETRQDYLSALEVFAPDIIISDFRLPEFDGLEALKLARELAADVPFIMLTGSMNEDIAVECMKAGAWDYVIKEHVRRLGAAAQGALELQKVRTERRDAEVSLRQSEQRLKVAQRLGRIGHWEFDLQSRQIHWSEAVFDIYGRDPRLGPPTLEEEGRYYAPEVARELNECAQNLIATGEPFELDASLTLPDGRLVDITTIGTAVTDGQGRVVRLLGTVQDITARNKANARIRHLNSVLRAIRSINQLITRERNPARLIQLATEMLVESRGFKGAWIGLLGANGGIATWAQAGFGADFEPFAQSLAAGEPPQCLAQALSLSSHVTVLEPKAHCAACPLSPNYGSDFSAVARLRHEGVNLGILGVVFPRELAADAEECAQLAELAADLSFGLCDIELERQRNRYAQIVANSQEAMALVGPDFIYLEANAAYRRLVNADDTTLVGRTVASVLGNGAFLARERPRLEQCLQGQEIQFETSQLGSGGADRFYDVVFSPCFAPDASVSAVAVGVRDITDRKLAELALEVERDNLRAFLAAAPAAILVLDQDARILHANNAAEQLFGRCLAEAATERCGDLVGCVHRHAEPMGCGAAANCKDCALSQVIQEAVKHGRTVQGQEIEVALENGKASQLHWLVANAGPLSLAGGRGAVLALHDVTERRQADELLRFQAMLLASQNEASIDGIWITDEKASTIWSNRRFAELWDLPTVPLGSPGAERDWLAEKSEDEEVCRGAIATLCTDRSAMSRDELRLKDGRTFDRYSAPIVDQTATYLGRVWLFRDITVEKRLQASVAQSDRLASMGLLAAGVAHEINNPLSYILYNLESLIDDLELQSSQSPVLRDELTKYLSADDLRRLSERCINLLDPATLSDMQARFTEALGGTRRIKEIARGLGTFSRVEKDRILPVELRSTIESAINIAFNEIKYRAQIVKDYQTSARVMASEGRLSQVFLNLLVNAAHAIPDGNVEGNRICIRTWDKEGNVYAEVSDTGCGIPTENLERVFDPFFTTKPVGFGTGLGLNIVRNIVAGYGGTIDISSEVGKWTRFLIRFPEAGSLDCPSELAPSSERGVQAPRGRILVVDDECAIRIALKRILKRHEVVEAESGEHARQLLESDQKFDLILCDLMMAKVSGIDLHEWLTQTQPQLVSRIVFVTGGAFTPASRAYLDKVENVCIEKPFDATNLLKMVNAWVVASKAKTAP